MKRGPKPKPLRERVMAKVVKAGECWIWQPKSLLIKVDGRTRSVVRALYEEQYGEPLHASNDPRSLCGHPKCVNLEHRKLEPRNPERYGGQHLPQALLQTQAPTDEQEIEDARCLIESSEPRIQTVEEFQAKFGEEWASENIREALRRIAAKE